MVYTLVNESAERGSVKLPPSTVRRRPPLKKVPRPRPRGRDRHLPLRPILFGLLAVLFARAQLAALLALVRRGGQKEGD